MKNLLSLRVLLQVRFDVLAIGLVAAVVAESTVASPYEHELIGQCFASQPEALKPFRLLDGTPDDSIALSPTDFARHGAWVVDRSSGHNFQWYLLEKTSRGYCYTLYVPFAAEIVGTRRNGVLTIEGTTQPSPSMSSFRMTFRRSTKLGRFVPYRCTESRDRIGARSLDRRTINCLTVTGQ